MNRFCAPTSSLSEHVGEVFYSEPLFGGDINDVSKIEASHGVFVLKKNDSSPAKMFEKEARGLKTLFENGIPVPKVYSYSENYLLMEYLPPGAPKPDEAGRALAKLHTQKQAYFGLNYNNYIGKLHQNNKYHKDWATFFWRNRIQYPLGLLNTKGVGLEDMDTWESLRRRLTNLLPPCEPTLIHGDLWSGNLYWSNKGAYFIDPAIYYADPMIELAFTELFGNFGKSFYKSYQENKPIPKEYAKLKPLYHIYPLLVHANLFGGGYYSSALKNAKIFI